MITTADTQLLQAIDNLFSSDKDRRGAAATQIVELIYLHDIGQSIVQSDTLRHCFESTMKALRMEVEPDNRTDMLEAMASIVSALGIKNIAVDLSPIADSIKEYDDDQLYTAISALAMSRDVKYVPLISRYLQHNHEQVRESAALAIQILEQPAS